MNALDTFMSNPKFFVDLTGLPDTPHGVILSPDINADNAAKIAEWMMEHGYSNSVFLDVMDVNSEKRGAIFRRLIEKELWSREMLCREIVGCLGIGTALVFADGLARNGEFDTILLACVDAGHNKSQAIVKNLAENGFLTQVGLIMKGGGWNTKAATESAHNEGLFTVDTDVSVMTYRANPKKA